jgi:hypothetical protein
VKLPGLGESRAAELRAACAQAATAEAVAKALFYVARSDYERAREAHTRAVVALAQSHPAPRGTLVHAMADIPCNERARLERAVFFAVQVLYGTKPEDRGPARVAEREAVRALEEHVKLHGCMASRNQHKS